MALAFLGAGIIKVLQPKDKLRERMILPAVIARARFGPYPL